MPFLEHHFLSPEGELGIWKIDEDTAFFESKLDMQEKEQQLVVELKGHRRTEWLASRFLLHLMSGRDERAACLKDEFGKPYLEDSFYHISMSHSREMTAVIAAPRLVGVDIQKLVGKIENIAHKFMRDEELQSLKTESRLEHLHVYWGAKEALYKAYGRKSLDFRTHIFVEPFDYDLSGGQCSGRVVKDDFDKKFEIHYRRIDDFILVYAWEDIGDVRIA